MNGLLDFIRFGHLQYTRPRIYELNASVSISIGRYHLEIESSIQPPISRHYQNDSSEETTRRRSDDFQG